MQIELSKEEVEKIILNYINGIFVTPQNPAFNVVRVPYSYFPEKVIISNQSEE